MQLEIERQQGQTEELARKLEEALEGQRKWEAPAESFRDELTATKEAQTVVHSNGAVHSDLKATWDSPRPSGSRKRRVQFWIVDHSNQIGQEKALLILGVHLDKLPPVGKTLDQSRVEALASIPSTSW